MADDRVASTLAEWRKTEHEASPGPWAVSEKHGMDIADEAWSEVKLTASDGSDVAALYISHLLENYNSDEDRAFITTARTAFPLLLAAIDAVLNRHPRSILPASLGEHKGRHFCRACTKTVDDFTLYADWPCPTVEAITTSLSGTQLGEDGKP